MKSVPDWLFSKWQEFADILAELLNVPAVLVMYNENEYMEVFLSSNSKDNPYKVGDREKWHGLYCETVIKSQDKLLIPNALKDIDWNNNPDIKLGMISYLGYPVNFPDDEPFGTVCVLDSKENGYNKTYEKLLYQFRDVVETDISLLYAFELKTNKLNKTIHEQHISLLEKQEKLAEQKEELEIVNSELRLTNEELNITNELLHEAKEKAEHSNRLKTAFMHNLSHEIRTPMNGILGFASMLNQSELPDDKIEFYVNLITRNCTQLLSIINNVLEVSQIQTGQSKLNIESFNLNDLLDELFMLFKPQAARKSIRLSLTNEGNTKFLQLVTDKEKLNGTLRNLLSNAVKFTNTGSIDFGCIVNPHGLEFFVRDTGIGISESEKEFIFEPFRQADISLSRGHGGTGVGLAICKGNVELLGGELSLDTQIGRGSTFSFILPLKKVLEGSHVIQ